MAQRMIFSVNNLDELTGGPDGTYGWDWNGNMTQDGIWTNTYDDENRLIAIEGEPNGVPYVLRLTLDYDGLGRLRRWSEYYQNDYGYWVLYEQAVLIYDGWRVIQERDPNNNPTVSYTRGTDLSGTLEGAGGIGGLLARSAGYSGGNWTSHAYYQSDGNGNVTYMVDGNQAMVASYKYDPYGNILSQSGSLATANEYRFSSKMANTTGVGNLIYYYGYRWYAPGLQRWMNRDPIAEMGFMLITRRTRPHEERNLYTFVRNNAVTFYDLLGLGDNDPPPCAPYPDCDYPKPSPPPPPTPPPPPQKCPTPPRPPDCWRPPSTAIKYLDPATWPTACGEAERACEGCCAIKFANDPTFDLQKCENDCLAEKDKCITE